MGILSAAKVAAIKAKIEAKALPDRAAITRVTRVVDSTTGGWTETEATYASGVPARVDKSGLSPPRERAIAERFGSVQTFTLMLSAVATRWPGGVIDVRAADRVTISGDSAGVYELAEDGGPVTDEMVREIIAIKIT